jgi:hypothetical protein
LREVRGGRYLTGTNQCLAGSVHLDWPKRLGRHSTVRPSSISGNPISTSNAIYAASSHVIQAAYLASSDSGLRREPCQQPPDLPGSSCLADCDQLAANQQRRLVVAMLSAFTARPIIELKQRDKSKIETILAYGTLRNATRTLSHIVMC